MFLHNYHLWILTTIRLFIKNFSHNSKSKDGTTICFQDFKSTTDSYFHDFEFVFFRVCICFMTNMKGANMKNTAGKSAWSKFSPWRSCLLALGVSERVLKIVRVLQIGRPCERCSPSPTSWKLQAPPYPEQKIKTRSHRTNIVLFEQNKNCITSTLTSLHQHISKIRTFNPMINPSIRLFPAQNGRE